MAAAASIGGVDVWILDFVWGCGVANAPMLLPIDIGTNILSVKRLSSDNHSRCMSLRRADYV